MPWANDYIELDGTIIKREYKVKSHDFCSDCQRKLDDLLREFIEGDENGNS